MSDSGAIAYRLQGRVDFGNLLKIREEGEAAIREGGDQPVIDLSGLENGNSAAVALLMAWFRLAENLGKELTFTAPPEELENIIALSGLDSLLPVRHGESESGAAGPQVKGAGGLDSQRSTGV